MKRGKMIARIEVEIKSLSTDMLEAIEKQLGRSIPPRTSTISISYTNDQLPLIMKLLPAASDFQLDVKAANQIVRNLKKLLKLKGMQKNNDIETATSEVARVSV